MNINAKLTLFFINVYKRTIDFLLSRPVYFSSLFLEMVFALSFHSFTSRPRELQSRMVPIKGTLTLKWDIGIRCSVLLVLNDDVPNFQNLCLFIWLSWTLCYWVGLRLWTMIKSYLMFYHLLVLLIFYLGIMNLVVSVT